MNSFILAVDIGTTSTKAKAVTANGQVIATDQAFYTTSFPKPGFVEQNAEAIFQAVVRSINSVLRDCSSSQCLGISFSAAMHSLLAVNETGNAITPLIIWADTRARSQSKKLGETSAAQELYETTGTPIHPMSPFCKLLWWNENQQEVIIRAFKLVSIKEYVVFHLTGQYVIDYSTASATGLFDIHKLEWSTRAQDFHKVPFSKFSTPVSIYHQVELTTKLLIEGNGHEKLIVGSSDGCAAHVGSHSLKQNALSITLGTSGAVRLATKEPMLHPEGLLFNYVLDESTFIVGGASNTGTSILDWFADKFDTIASKNLVDFIKEIETISPGSDGLIALPYLHGERAPIYDPEVRGVFFGVSVNHTRLHFQRALVEGICFSLKSILNLIEDTEKKPRSIYISGGIVHSTIWLQLLSDVLGRQLIVSSTEDASTLGAAIIGFKSLDMVFQQASSPDQIIYPTQEASAMYAKHFALFETIYKQTASSFQMLGQLRH